MLFFCFYIAVLRLLKLLQEARIYNKEINAFGEKPQTNFFPLMIYQRIVLLFYFLECPYLRQWTFRIIFPKLYTPSDTESAFKTTEALAATHCKTLEPEEHIPYLIYLTPWDIYMRFLAWQKYIPKLLYQAQNNRLVSKVNRM